MNIIERLYELQDKDYQSFHSRSVPNIPAESIIGVRIPLLKKLAKELSQDPCREAFMKQLPHKYYEENQLHIMLICLEKDFDTCISEMEKFLPYADNWAVTDQSSPKCFKRKHRELLPVLERWLASEHVYTARYAINIYMREFLEEDFDIKYAELISRKQGEDYYLKMMIAWYFATALAKQYDAAVTFLEERKLEKWTHNKAIQKAIESYRVSEEHKTYLRSLKIR